MNSTFKVVFNKARGALMVVNEVTSSVQAKGTKTVVATAVAAMIAGVAGTAMAEATPVTGDTSVTIGAGGVVTVVGDVTTSESDGTTKVTGDVKKGADAAESVTLGTSSEVTLVKGTAEKAAGKLVIEARPYSADPTSTDAAGKVAIKSLKGTGTVVITANGYASADALTTAGGSVNGATLTVGDGSTMTNIGTADNEDLTFVFNAKEGAHKHGTSTLAATKGLTFGAVQASEDRAAAGKVTFDVAAGADGFVDAGTGALTLNNVAFNNLGTLTLRSTDGTDGVVFNVAYDATSEGNTGDLVVDGISKINEDFTSTIVYVGTNPATAAEGKVEGVKAELKGNVTVGPDVAFTATDLYVDQKTFATVGEDKKGVIVAADTLTVKGGETASGVVNIGLHDAMAVVGAVKLVGGTNGAKATVAGELSGESLAATRGGNVVETAGKTQFKSLTVAAVPAVAGTSDPVSSELTVSGAGQFIVTEAVKVNGEVAGSNTGAGTLTFNMTEPATSAKYKYNATLGSVEVLNLGTVDVQSGKIQVLGDMTVAKGATLKSTAFTGKLFVDGTLTLAKDSVATAVLGETKVGTLDNATTATFGTLTADNLNNTKALTATTLTVKNGENTGNIIVNKTGVADIAQGKIATIKGGSFVNKAVYGDTAATADQIQNSFKVTGDNTVLFVDEAEFVNEGKVAVQNLELGKNATYKSALLLAADADADTTNKIANTKIAGQVVVGEGSTFEIVALNERVAAETDTDKAKDTLTLQNAWILDGGAVAVKDKAFSDLNVKVDANLTVKNGSSFDANKVTLKGGTTFTIGAAGTDNDSVVSIKTLDARGAKVAIVDTLNVTQEGGSFYTGVQNESANEVTIAASGALNLTAGTIGMSIDATTGVAKYAKIADTAVQIFNGVKTNDGEITVTGLNDTIAYGKIGSMKTTFGLTGAGLLYVPDLEIKFEAADLTDGNLKAETAIGLGGIVAKNTATSKVVGVTADQNLLGQFTNVEMATGVATLTTADNKTLILTGTGDLVSYKPAADKAAEAGSIAIGANGIFEYDGTTANLKGISGDTGTVAVTGGDLTVAEAVSVAKGYVEEGASLTIGNGASFTGALGIAGKLETVKGDVSVNKADIEGTMIVGAETTTTTGTYPSNFVLKGKNEVKGYLEALGNVDLTDGDATLAVYEGGVAKLGTVTAGSNRIDVGSAEEDSSSNGVLIVDTLKSGNVYVDPAWDENGVVALGDESRAYVNKVDTAGTVNGDQASLTVLGTHDADEVNAALAQAGFTQFQKEDGYAAVLYINGAAKVAGKVYVDGSDEGTGHTGTIAATAENATNKTADTLTVINGASFGEEAVTEGVVSLNDVFVANAAVGQEIKLTSASGGATITGDLEVSSGRILDVSLEDGVLSVGLMDDDDLGALALVSTIDTLKSYYVNGQNLNETKSKSAIFNEAMMQMNNGTSGQIETAAIIEDVAAIGATAGMASVTMDALSAFNDTVAARTSILAPNAEGVTVWADVNGGRYEAKKLMDGAGYSSDIYAGVLGVDTTVACGAKIGAAITVGTGDTDSKNTVAETSMDSDFFGVSIYTAKQFGVANVAIDLGYMQGSNDVDVKAFNLGKFSADSDAFTLGVRGELLTKAGDFNIVPHAGLRWTRISVDSFEAGYDTDIDSMNVFQLPVGVTVSGEFEGAGFTWAPAFDLSFVPAFGDKDADMTLGIRGANAQTSQLGVQVIDSNPVQATIGIDATNGAWAFGLNYKLGVGTDSRMNNSFNANVRYTF